MEELIKLLEENKDKETQIEMKLFDTKSNRAACKVLTVKELMLIKAGVDFKWWDLPTKGVAKR